MINVWPSKPLGELTTFLNGLWKGEKPPFVTVGVIRNTNFAKDGSIDDSDIASLVVEARKFEKRKLKFGDIILEKSGGGPKQPVGRVALFNKKDGDYSFSNFTSAVRVNDPRELDFRFLHKFLFWKYASGVTESMQSHSTGIRNLNAEAYKEIAVPLPSLPEQQRIVAILDEAVAGLATATANAEKNLKNAHELFKSYVKSIFAAGWEAKALAEVCENLDSKRVPITKSKRKAGPIPYYGASGVVDHVADYIFDEDLLLVSEDGANLVMRTYPIAFSISGKSWVNNHAHVLRFEDQVSRRFAEYYLNSISLVPYVSGMAQPKLNQKALNSIPIPWPLLDERQHTVARLDELASQVEQLDESYEARLTSLAELKQSILQKAFSGELTSPPTQAIREAAE